MNRVILFLFLSSFSAISHGQFVIPSYSIVKDSATHITVVHTGNSEKIKLSERQYSDTLSIISPDVNIKNGIVDHKGMTGDMYVREYYVDSVLIGYIEFDGINMQLELYFNNEGKVFLEKIYDKGVLTKTDTRVRSFLIKRVNK